MIDPIAVRAIIVPMPLVIPVFIPHLGCPHRCVFCNQYRISGCAENSDITPSGVAGIINDWLGFSPVAGREVQVAFYGGSFTGMALSRQEELLDAVSPFLRSGKVHAIRLSTRPDYIDHNTIDFLRRKNVDIVELGVQSLDDAVLNACRRGHTARQSMQALGMLQEGGFKVGAQLMLGLPGQTAGSLRKTVQRIIELQPDFVRIYPAVVLRGSMLADLYEKNQYNPLSLGKAVVQAAKMKECFAAAGIPVVRIGLQAGPELEKNLLAGPYHPAFGELVGSRIMLRKTRRILRDVQDGGEVILTINEKDQSLFRGLGSSNMKRLADLNLSCRFRLQTDAGLPRYSVELSRQFF